MFFVFLLAVLPDVRSKLAYATGYRDAYNYVERRAIEWHKSELEQLDFDYASQQAQFRLVAAREKAHAAGIGPLDPRYPDILEFLPKMRSRLGPEEQSFFAKP